MKISPKQYAAALHEAVKGKSREEAGRAVSHFAQVLKDAGDMKKADSIIEEFGAIWNKEHGTVELTVVTAEALGGPEEKALKESIKTAFHADAVVLHKQEDKRLIGGAVFRYKDVILDASIRMRLERLKEEMRK